MKKITIDEMKQHIISVLPDNVTLIDFSYDAKCFGNIIAQIKNAEKLTPLLLIGVRYGTTKQCCVIVLINVEKKRILSQNYFK